MEPLVAPIHIFPDRAAAGRRLAVRLEHLRDSAPVVLALPQGGVPVAFEVADYLHAPMDLVLVRKIPTPGVPTGCLGTVSEGGASWYDEEQVRRLLLRPYEIDRLVEQERRELEAQERRYRSGRPRLDLTDREVIVIDDGASTGRTADVALRSVKLLRPSRVYFAAGVISPEAYHLLSESADDVVAALFPTKFRSIHDWFLEYPDVSDAEVEQLLRASRDRHESAEPARW